MNPYRWSNASIRKQVAVLNKEIEPSIILKNATYLNTYLNTWLTANIWIYEDRIVYVGESMPENLIHCQVIDCKDQYLVPGYIDPHVHPTQLHNPLSFARYVGAYGTTTLISDNLPFLRLDLDRSRIFDLLEEFNKSPYNMYWWARLDPQTEGPLYPQIFNTENVMAWISNKNVLQSGELTAWPKLVAGDDEILTWIQETKSMRKKVEGHFPGASENTLGKLKLFGADCDHEAMTGKEVLTRLNQGYYVNLRNSSIRPDLDILLGDLMALGLKNFNRLFMTTDGSHPYFYEHGGQDLLIKKAMEHGVPLIDAYKMVSFNIAEYYNMEDLHGSIAVGRIANINILSSMDHPSPHTVLSKGVFITKEKVLLEKDYTISWDDFGIRKSTLNWDLEENDFILNTTTGMHLINNVISKPYESQIDFHRIEETLAHDESILIMIGKDGSWRVNTVLKGFTNTLGALVSSYSGTGDLLIIGKNKEDMMTAFNEVKKIGGGIVLCQDKKILHTLHLPLMGSMSDLGMELLIDSDKKMIEILRSKGYDYADPAFTLLFLSATHLPFIRITPKGLLDVKNNQFITSVQPRRKSSHS